MYTDIHEHVYTHGRSYMSPLIKLVYQHVRNLLTCWLHTTLHVVYSVECMTDPHRPDGARAALLVVESQ